MILPLCRFTFTGALGLSLCLCKLATATFLGTFAKFSFILVEFELLLVQVLTSDDAAELVLDVLEVDST